MENNPSINRLIDLSLVKDDKNGRINPVTLAFESESLEKQYWQWQLPEMRKRSILAFGTATFLYVLFAFLDPWIVPEVLDYVWYIRGIAVLVGMWLILLAQGPAFEKWHQLIIAGMPILGGAGILIIIMLAESVGRQVYYVAIILATIWTLLHADLRFVYGLPICLGYIVVYEIYELGYSNIPTATLLNNTFFLASALVMSAIAGYVIERTIRINFYQSMQIAEEHERAEKLLLNILPKDITEVLKIRSGTIADRFDEASILFADIVDFTPISSQMAAEEMVVLLNETFTYFDSLVEKYGLEKIRTIGDNYMVAAGVPRPRKDHAQVLAQMALEMCEFSKKPPPVGKPKLEFRIGINSGPVVAGIIGIKKFQYDVWGDAVNTASRMESQGLAGQIQISEKTYEMIKDEFHCVPRGTLDVKGVGPMNTYLLVDYHPSDGKTKNLPLEYVAPVD
jgi:adenylate cyclase